MLRTIAKTSKRNISFAKTLRKSGNPAEKYLWSKLRRKQFFGLRFRRQVPFGPYVLDFLCVEKKLVIEIDGDSHYESTAQQKDTERDSYLKKFDFLVLRLSHRETLQNIDGALVRIGRVTGLDPSP